MKKIIFATISAFCIICTLCAFTFDLNSSVKTLTHPYINTYYCTEARLGEINLLEKYEYFIITILDDEELEISFKKHKWQKYAFTCNYEFNEETHELSAGIGILGFTYRQKTIINGGTFYINMLVLNKPLFMKFEVK